MASVLSSLLPSPTAAIEKLHLNPPHRAEHVGSLLRPAQLLEKRKLFQQNKITAEELRKEEDEAIATAVRLQKELGFKTITDGELRRGAYYDGAFDKLDGFKAVVRPLGKFKSYLPYVQAWNMMGLTEALTIFCDGKIKRTKGIYTDDFTYLKGLVAPEEVKNLKVTICGPIYYHLRHGSEETYALAIYENDDEYFADLGQAYREEIQALYALGCRHIQFDEPCFTFFCAESMLSGMKAAGENPEQLFDRYVKWYNEILAGRPADLTISMHLCRGNYMGMSFCEGGYDIIASKLFNELNVDCYYLEYDNERAGDFTPLKHLPLNKSVVLGLVTTKNGTMETLEELQADIEEAVDIIAEAQPKRSRAYALNQVCVSPQCGFASVAEGNPITAEDQKKKLALVAEAAKVLE